MKPQINFIVLMAAVVFSFTACSLTRTVTLDVTLPAEVKVPSDVKTILLVNRTRPTHKVLNFMEALFTGEIGADENSVPGAALMALKVAIEKDKKYNVKILDMRLPGNSLNSKFPEPLHWKYIEEISKKEQADMVMALEIYDSDYSKNHGQRIEVSRGWLRGGDTTIKYFNNLEAQARLGFRTYYLKDHSIYNINIINKSNTWGNEGRDEAEANS